MEREIAHTVTHSLTASQAFHLAGLVWSPGHMCSSQPVPLNQVIVNNNRKLVILFRELKLS